MNSGITHNYLQARYHFSLAARLGDKAAKEKLKDTDIVNEDASRLFASEFLNRDEESFNRLLNDRVFYLSNQTRIDGEVDNDGVIIGHCEGKVGLCVTGRLTEKNLKKVIDEALSYYFVDASSLSEIIYYRLEISRDNKVTLTNPSAQVILMNALEKNYSIMVLPVSE